MAQDACQESQKLSYAADGILKDICKTPAEVEALQEHMKTCERCQTTYRYIIDVVLKDKNHKATPDSRIFPAETTSAQ